MDATDDLLRDVLGRVKTVACVGVSMNPVRPSYFVARYQTLRGYKVFPVNPMHAGERLFGQTVVASLQDLKTQVDMIDIFRRPEHVPPLVEQGLAQFPNLIAIWMQIGVRHEAAALSAQAKGVTVIQDRCPKIEYQRLFGELRMGGFNTGVISSKLT